MAFTRKLKTQNKWFRVNELARNDASLATAINGDGGCNAIKAEMETLVKAIYAEALNTSADDAEFTIDRIVPMPWRMWAGILSYDTFTPAQRTVKKGSNAGARYTAYIANHEAQFRDMASRLRDRIDTIIEIRRMTNDLGEADQSPNPGGNPKLAAGS